MFKSLRSKLMTLSLGFLTLAWLITLIAGYLLTRATLNAQLDSELRNMAQTLLERPQVLHRQTVIIERDRGIEFQIFQDDKMIAFSDSAPKESLYNGEGFSQGDADQKQWRVFSTGFQNSHVAVAQDIKFRKRLVQNMIVSSLWPMVVVLPFIALILWLSVNIALTPLTTLAQEIQSRKPQFLSPVRLSGVPIELAPVVRSVNDLLAALEAALEREKHFTDDAAHELRTPLAGIKAQAEALRGRTTPTELGEGLNAIHLGVDRASHIVTQLLTLARLDPKNPNLHFKMVNLSALAAQTIALIAPRALQKSVEVNLNSNSQAHIYGDTLALESLLSNLLDNALKIAPPHSSIEVAVHSGAEGVRLTVEDSGPGIAPADRERVFERFVRLNRGNAIDGSGLGLAIVKRIVTLHCAKIVLAAGKDGSGLCVQIDFPSGTKMSAKV